MTNEEFEALLNIAEVMGFVRGREDEGAYLETHEGITQAYIDKTLRFDDELRYLQQCAKALKLCPKLNGTRC